MKKVLLGALLTSAIGLAALVHADGYKHHHRGHGEIAAKLELTEAQTTEFNAIHEQMRDAAPGPVKHLVMKEMMALNPADADYQTQLDALAEQKAQEVRHAVLTLGQAHAKVYDLLTPEQREKAQVLRKEMREEMHGNRQEKREKRREKHGQSH